MRRRWKSFDVLPNPRNGLELGSSFVSLFSRVNFTQQQSVHLKVRGRRQASALSKTQVDLVRARARTHLEELDTERATVSQIAMSEKRLAELKALAQVAPVLQDERRSAAVERFGFSIADADGQFTFRSNPRQSFRWSNASQRVAPVDCSTINIGEVVSFCVRVGEASNPCFGRSKTVHLMTSPVFVQMLEGTLFPADRSEIVKWWRSRMETLLDGLRQI